MNTVEAWPRCPQTAAFFVRQFRDFAAENPLLETLEARFYETAGVNILNLIDHWIFPDTPGLTDELTALGLVETTLPEGDKVWKHPAARLPGVRIKSKRTTPCLALLVENISDFAKANGLELEACHGDADAAYQCAHLTLPNGELMPITRNGYAGYAPGTLTESDAEKLAAVREAFHNRDRDGDETDVIARAKEILLQAAEQIGRDRATDEFFLSERTYYMGRNSAARWQYAQQQKIGIGWANHDHHTYRCSRASFRALIILFHTMGFVSRERFYAGAEAGWGAQVLEHPVSRVVIFSDVDVAPEELNLDFANVNLPERDTLGTIGLWCALHTSSIAEAGLHHLEAEFDFEKAEANCKASGYGVMAPFTDLPMLKQAFTEPENWQVAPKRVQALRERGLITQAQGEKFLTQGAPGSHLEILQRWEGFKGFNKTGISDIIRQTDARIAV